MSAASEAKLRVRLFGRYEVWREGHLLTMPDWGGNRKTQTLAKILLTQRGQVYTQDQLVEYLYPDLEPDKAIANLYKRISELRKALEPARAKGEEPVYILGGSKQGYSFSTVSAVWLDVESFAKEIERAGASQTAGRWPEALTHYQEAIALYAGEFLAEDLYEEWSVVPREHWKERYIHALAQAGECQARLGQYAQAIALCQKAISLKPSHESLYRQQMLYHFLLDQKNEAVKVYEACAKALSEYLGVAISVETKKLYDEIESGEIASAKNIYPVPISLAKHNLANPLTSFVGRAQELEAIKNVLTGIGAGQSVYPARQGARTDTPQLNRLLTLIGAGGSGKTRLALQTAWQVLGQYAHGVWWVELAPITKADLVAQAIASALGVPDQTQQPLFEMLTSNLKHKHLLLILDNCEHLITECAHLAHELLNACPQLQILATSRAPLGLAEERTWPVPPLALPDLQTLPPLKVLQQYEAIGLFVERALFSQPHFELSSANAPAIVQVCQQLDGLPLAIELAAARVKILSPEQIAGRLSDRFKLLTSGSKTALPHHQALKATIDWSYDLLEEKEKKLWQRLSVFLGGWTLDAAEKVCVEETPTLPSPVLTNRGGKKDKPIIQPSPFLAKREGLDQSTSPLRSGEELAVGRSGGLAQSEISGLLNQLIDKSIVLLDHKLGEARYRMLETVREYGREKLVASGEIDAAQRRHAEYVVSWSDMVKTKLHGPDQVLWLDRVELEHRNVRAALQWASEKSENEIGLRIAGTIWWFWYVRGYWNEAVQHLERYLAQATELSSAAYSRGALGLGYLFWAKGELPKARVILEANLATQRKGTHSQSISDTLTYLGIVVMSQADSRRARDYFEESLKISQNLGDKSGTALALCNLGIVTNEMQGIPAGTQLQEESLALFRELRDEYGVLVSIICLFTTSYSKPARERQKLLKEALGIAESLRCKQGIGITLANLGFEMYTQGNFINAKNYYEKSLSIAHDLGDMMQIGYCLKGMAEIESQGENWERAAKLMGSAQAILKLGDTISPNDLADFASQVTVVRERLGDSLFEERATEGRAMTLEAAIAFALREEAD